MWVSAHATSPTCRSFLLPTTAHASWTSRCIARRSARPAYSRVRMTRILTDGLDPFPVVLDRPLLVDPAARHPAQGMPCPRVEHGEKEVAEEEQQRHVHQPVVHEQCLRQPEAGIALAVPEEEAGEREQDGERGGDHRVELLPRVETSLRRLATSQPRAIVGVEAVDLPCRAEEGATV